MTLTTRKIFSSADEAGMALCDYVTKTANEAIDKNGSFTVGVSGGSLPKFLCAGLVPKPGLPEAERKNDFSKWKIFFCDERYVPLDDQECTYNVYKRDLVDKVEGMTEHNIFPINPDLPLEDAAKDYISRIKKVFGDSEELPKFDLLLLGMGPDGHTCSLFPAHNLLEETSEMIVTISDSPKPPPSRITMTYPIINNAAAVVFLSCGAGKAEILKQVLEPEKGSVLLPAARVKPDGQLIWFMDEAAAAQLSKL